SLPFLPAGYAKRLATVTNTSADTTGSAQARWEDTVSAIHYIAKNPIIGAGIGQDILALNEERGLRWRSVHNVFLQQGVELGLPGLVLFVLLLSSCLRAALALERRPDAGELSSLAVASGSAWSRSSSPASSIPPATTSTSITSPGSRWPSRSSA